MPLKVTLEMACEGQTWTESHYYLPQAVLPFNDPALTDLTNARAALLGNNAFLTGVRVSLVPANRVVTDYFVQTQGLAGTWPPDPTGLIYSASIPNAALLIKMNGGGMTPTPQKSLYLAGPPAATIATGVSGILDINPIAAFLIALGKYMFQLTGSASQLFSTTGPSQVRWGYRTRSSQNTVVAVGPPVTNAGFPGMVGIQVFSTLPGVVVGGQVWLSGWRRLNPRIPGLAGAWTVAGILPPTAPNQTPTTYFLANSGNVSPTNFKGIGSIAPLSFNYTPYGLGYLVEKAVTRKRGESVGLRRGRLLRRR